MSIKEMVVNKTVSFVRFQNNELWYTTECGFEFPVPLVDTKEAIFLNQDKASYFMRWLRKHLETIEAAKKEHTQAV